MNVSSSNTGILPFSVQPLNTVTARQEQSGNGTKSDQSFEQVLEQFTEDAPPTSQRPERIHPELPLHRSFAAFEQGMTIGAGSTPYTLRVEIGDSALAFEAMPLVGPSAVLPEGEAVRATSPRQILAPEEVIPTADGPTLPTSRPDMDTAFSMRPTDGRLAASERLASTQVQTPVPMSKSTMTAASAQPSAGNMRSVQGGTTASHSPQSTQANQRVQGSSPMQHFAVKAHVFAQLVAAANEYRVAVRGVQLTATERDDLITSIRTALRSHGLADLPISLTSNSGAA